jgi:hypothetical protein
MTTVATDTHFHAAFKPNHFERTQSSFKSANTTFSIIVGQVAAIHDAQHAVA